MKTEQASYERRSKEKWADCRQERDFWIMEVVRLEAENARLREATNRNFRFKPQRHSHLSQGLRSIFESLDWLHLLDQIRPSW